MDSSRAPVVKDVVLVGGGHSHVTVLRRFGMDPVRGVRLTLISRDTEAPYSGMLPGLIAGHYEFDEAHIDLGPLCRFAGVRFFHDEVVGLDLDGKRVRCRDHPPVAWDLLSIDIGSSPGMEGVPGAREHVVPVKPIDRFWRHWTALEERCLERDGRAEIAVVGGGAGGVELLLAVQFRLGRELEARGLPPDAPGFVLATSSQEILPAHNRRTRRKFERILRERDVRLLTGHEVVRVTPADRSRRGAGSGQGVRLHFSGGDDLQVDEVLWVTTAGAQAWPGRAGLDVDEAGFIRVDEELRSTSHPDVFAVGDISSSVRHPRPKAGVFAVRQGPPLTENLRRRLRGEPLRPFVPQRRHLGLISTGDRYAVASRSWWALEGAWVWRWKDWLDRRFVRKYNDLPEMRADEAPPVDPRVADDEALRQVSSTAMRCRGCGSKIGITVLERALARLEPFRRREVLLGLEAPDDAAVVEAPDGEVLVQTIDFFRAFVDDPFVFGQVAANHALGDVYAMGAEPRTALAVATVPHAVEAKVEEDLVQLLAGAVDVLEREETSLVGGHSAEGDELALGLAVIGAGERDTILDKAGLRPGDELVLTKPLGTGALFAADMRHEARGRWIEAALRSMVQSNRAGAECLRRHGARGLTDVTGFGLLGHLLEMLRASGVDAEVDLEALPAMAGVLEVMGKGIFSTLQPQNARSRRALRGVERAADSPAYPLLFDPQTGGGLLAGVGEGRADGCVEELQGLGYRDASVIGRVVERSGELPTVTLA